MKFLDPENLPKKITVNLTDFRGRIFTEIYELEKNVFDDTVYFLKFSDSVDDVCEICGLSHKNPCSPFWSIFYSVEKMGSLLESIITWENVDIFVDADFVGNFCLVEVGA